ASVPLFFANAERHLGLIAVHTEADPGLWAIIVSLEESVDLDSTALEALIEFDDAMKARSVRVQLARVHDHVRDLLALSSETNLAARCSYSVADAVETIRPLIADLEKAR